MENNAIDSLKQWLYTEGRQKQWLARQLGVAPSQVSRWLAGKMRPRPVHRAALDKLTLGAVPVTLWDDTVDKA